MKTNWTKRCVRVAAALPVVASTLILSGCIVEPRPRPVYYQPAPQPVYVQQQPPPQPVYVQQQPPPPGYVAEPPPPGYVAEPPPGAVVVTDAPPPEEVEVIPAQPDPTFVWVGGFWIQDHGSWVWQRGSWQRPPRPGAHFEPDRWQPARGGGYVRVQGGWR
jgi:hypothetical protein